MTNRVGNHHRWHDWQYATLGFGILIIVLAACSPSTPSMLDSHGPQADKIAALSWLMFGIAALVFIVVTSFLLVAFIRSRRESLIAQASSDMDRRAIMLVLVGGAVIPVVVLFAIMVLSVTADPANAAFDHSALNIEVIGYRWWWEVHYPDQSVTTANEIHIPVNQPVVLHVTSADVIHSLWIPQLNGKFDMIPGQTNTVSIEASNVGVYRGECAEFCGMQHAHMSFMVVAEDANQFNKWQTNQQKPAAALDPSTQSAIFEGQQTFLGSSCVYCHTIKGTNASGILGPDLTHIASRATIGAGVLANTPGNLAGWIINSQAIKPGNLMPPMDLDSDQLQAILAYFRTLQ